MVQTAIKTLPMPAFFNGNNASEWGYSPNLRSLFEQSGEHRKKHSIKASATDKKKIHLLIIDAQKDFCFPQGTLYVGGRSGTGAIDDNRRTAEFIYRNMEVITEITPTMDTHIPFQIFFPSFWVDGDGNAVQPHDVITGDLTIMRFGQPAGKASVNPAVSGFLGGSLPWLQKQAEFYCQQLEKGGRYQLYIWPEHCIMGGDGHALAGVIQEARMFHSYVRQMQSEPEVKGGNPLTENYSIFAPEVLMRWDGQPLAQKNTRFIKKMTQGKVIGVGQAGSHCVKSSLEHLLEEIMGVDPALAKNVYIPSDLTSPVAVPNPAGGFFVDFTPQQEAVFQKCADAGMNIVKSTAPIDSWPGIFD